MADIEKDVQELKKEVIEARNLVIKTDNLLKNLHAEVKNVAEKQRAFEKKSVATSATAYILFAALASLGAYMFAKTEMKAKDERLNSQQAELAEARKTVDDTKGLEKETKEESARYWELYQRMAGSDDDKRNKALTEVATMQPKRLSPLEIQALKDKAQSLRQAAANDALDNGKAAFNRHDWKACAEELGRYVTLATGKVDDVALLDLGQARHQLKDFKNAVEPLEAFLKAVPNSKSGDYVTMLLGESLAESGEKEKAIQVYRSGADKYSASQSAPWMRARARRLEQELKAAAAAGTPAAPAAGAPAPAEKPQEASTGTR